MKKAVRLFLPLFVTLIVIIATFLSWSAVIPGDELGVGILYHYILLPACAAFAGVWYGIFIKSIFKWLIPFLYFFLEVVVICTSVGQVMVSDFIYYSQMGFYAGIPCLVTMVLTVFVKRLFAKGD